MVKKLPANTRDIRDSRFEDWVGKTAWREGMATHTSILAWRIPWAEKPGGLQSMGLNRVGYH